MTSPSFLAPGAGMSVMTPPTRHIAAFAAPVAALADDAMPLPAAPSLPALPPSRPAPANRTMPPAPSPDRRSVPAHRQGTPRSPDSAGTPVPPQGHRRP